MEAGIERFAALCCLIVGVSHVLQPRVWVDFFSHLRARGEVGVFAIALLALIFGSVVVAFHNVWTGLPAVVTLLGWAQLVKAAIYLTWPQWGLRGLAWLTPERSYVMIPAGVMLVALSALIAISSLVS